MENLITFAVILFILWLILRELVCWYFKINQISDTLRRIEIQLKQINKDKLTAQDLLLITAEQRRNIPPEMLSEDALAKYQDATTFEKKA